MMSFTYPVAAHTYTPLENSRPLTASLAIDAGHFPYCSYTRYSWLCRGVNLCTLILRSVLTSERQACLISHAVASSGHTDMILPVCFYRLPGGCRRGNECISTKDFLSYPIPWGRRLIRAFYASIRRGTMSRSCGRLDVVKFEATALYEALSYTRGTNNQAVISSSRASHSLSSPI